MNFRIYEMVLLEFSPPPCVTCHMWCVTCHITNVTFSNRISFVLHYLFRKFVDFLNFTAFLISTTMVDYWCMIQFEIEHRSCGQSMINFRFFSCGGQTNFTGCHSFFMDIVRNLQKKMEKMSNIIPVVALH